MKKQLLFIVGFFLLTIISCSKEESNEITISEKENLVKQTIIEFNKSAVKTGKYNDFLDNVSRKFLKSSLTKSELELLLQSFLNEQSQEFREVYYQLVALNLTRQEFLEIAYELDHLRLNITNDLGKSQSVCCTIADAVGDADSTGSIGSIFEWACCERGQAAS